MKRVALLSALCVGLSMTCFGTSTAQARSPFSFSFGFGGSRVSVGNYGYSGSYGRSSHLGPSSHYSRGHYDYHDTSHFDYIPGHSQRHGNHYDYIPGRYQYHSTGHYDWHQPLRGHRLYYYHR